MADSPFLSADLPVAAVLSKHTEENQCSSPHSGKVWWRACKLKLQLQQRQGRILQSEWRASIDWDLKDRQTDRDSYVTRLQVLLATVGMWLLYPRPLKINWITEGLSSVKSFALSDINVFNNGAACYWPCFHPFSKMLLHPDSLNCSWGENILIDDFNTHAVILKQ